MNKIIRQVTPLTRAIIWIVKDECTSDSPYYAEIDYLLDGLLTSYLRSSKIHTSNVIIGKNFDNPIYVMILNKVMTSEVESFAQLVKENLRPENDILVIDEARGLGSLKNELKSISTNIKLLQ